jgi:hypothetical protein
MTVDSFAIFDHPAGGLVIAFLKCANSVTLAAVAAAAESSSSFSNEALKEDHSQKAVHRPVWRREGNWSRTFSA